MVKYKYDDNLVTCYTTFICDNKGDDNMSETDKLQQLLQLVQTMSNQINEMREENTQLKESVNQLNYQLKEMNNQMSVFQECVKEINKNKTPDELVTSVKNITERALGDNTEANVIILDADTNKWFTLDNEGERKYLDINENDNSFVSKTLYGGKSTVLDNQNANLDIGDKGVLEKKNRNIAIQPIKSDKNEIMGAMLISKETDISHEELAISKYIGNSFGTALTHQKLEAENKILQCDQLTGLQNRHGAEKYLKNTVVDNAKNNKPTSVVFMDIDNFKMFNDKYGHAAGDAVLKGVAEILKNNCREGIDCAYRFGGEEEGIILGNVNETQAMIIAERIRKEINEKEFDIGNGKTVHVSVSVGTAQFSNAELKQLTKANAYDTFEKGPLSRADENVYASKTKGKNCITGSKEATLEYSRLTKQTNTSRYNNYGTTTLTPGNENDLTKT